MQTKAIMISWPADEGTELGLDQLPGVAELLPLRAGDEARDQVDGVVALEDPVGRGREREQDRDQDLERLLADREGRDGRASPRRGR